MPFITEEIWSFLPKNEPTDENPENFLIKESWPLYDKALTFEAEVKKLELAMEVIRSIRNIRAEAEAAPSRKLSAIILSSGKEPQQSLPVFLVYDFLHIGTESGRDVVCGSFGVAGP
jgi:valyl-tRNA synthetase